jgi:hypothetical protein
MNDKNITDADKKFDMGYRYYYGEGVEQDYTKAALLFMDAAEQGHAAAQCNLGMCYYCGNGTEQDDELAAYWLKEAAKQGYVEAMFCLAIMFEESPEAQKLREGLLWLILAAKQDDTEAKKLLADMRHIDYELAEIKADELIALAEKGEIKNLADYGVRYFTNAGTSAGAAKLKFKRIEEVPPYSHLKSHFYGQPYFEEGEQWPVTKEGKMLDFVFQIFNAGNYGLPVKIKLLQFYYDFDKSPWSDKDGRFIKIYENINIDNAVILAPGCTKSYYYNEIEFEPISPREKRDYGNCNQIGGKPQWLQGDTSPGGGFQFLFQLDSDAPGVYWGDEGIVYAYYNPNTKKTWFELQSH